MEFNFTQNDVFGSRGRLYQENGVSQQAVENAHQYGGHKGIKELVNQAQVTRAPQVTPTAPSPEKLHSFKDSFEKQQPVAHETMTFAKMAAAMASMRGMA